MVDATTKTITPMTHILVWPKMSESRPPEGEQRGQGDQVAVDHPLHAGRREAELALDVRHGDGDDRLVDERHRRPRRSSRPSTQLRPCMPSRSSPLPPVAPGRETLTGTLAAGSRVWRHARGTVDAAGSAPSREPLERPPSPPASAPARPGPVRRTGGAGDRRRGRRAGAPATRLGAAGRWLLRTIGGSSVADAVQLRGEQRRGRPCAARASRPSPRRPGPGGAPRRRGPRRVSGTSASRAPKQSELKKVPERSSWKPGRDRVVEHRRLHRASASGRRRRPSAPG